VEGDRLSLDRDAMRELGYRTVDALVEWMLDEHAPPIRRATPEEIRSRLHGPPPEEPEAFEDVLAQLERDVLPFTSRGAHPGFFAFIPFATTWPGALGDFIASACNVYGGSWMESAGPSQVELEVLSWFAEWLGLPGDASGILTSGGSSANLNALACARETRVARMDDRLVVYVADQAHSSLARAARVLGFRPHQVRVLPTDADFRLQPATVAEAIDADARAGLTPLFVSASGGATNTGAVDPLRELADVCRSRDVWFHVDAAYGGFAVLTERGRKALDGIDLAESVTLDPHKWLYQRYECGCLLVRQPTLLRRAFEITPDYLRDARCAETEVNFADRGLQLTRAARAFKVWVSLRTLGVSAFRDAIDRCLDLAETAAERIEASDALELVAPPSLGVLCFRRRFERDSEAGNAGVVAALERSGLGLVSSTRLHGEYAIRMCILAHTSRAEDVERVLDFLETAEPVADPAGVARHERHPQVSATAIATDVDRRALLSRLSNAERQSVVARASRRQIAEGETVVERWDSSRDFFLIEDGSAEVYVADDRVRELGPGDFFGELGALDWGAGFSYPRLATVVAKQPLSLLVFPDGSLNQLIRDFPVLGDEITARAHERAQRH
jgi:aromatic-L-amino-acid decarboxylase